MNESISIQVQVANRTYSLKVSPDEGNDIMKASELITERLTALQKSHGIKDPQDTLAMLLVQFAAEKLKGKSISETEEQESSKRIAALSEKVSSYINSL